MVIFLLVPLLVLMDYKRNTLLPSLFTKNADVVFIGLFLGMIFIESQKIAFTCLSVFAIF